MPGWDLPEVTADGRWTVAREAEVDLGPDNLPRLLYIGDVAVEPTVAGMALLYRLLQGYPPTKLCIVQSNLLPAAETRLPGVVYRTLSIGPTRPVRTRFAAPYGAYLYLTAPLAARRLLPLARDIQPQAILTVAHGVSWRSAAALARRLDVPLHLIVHDDRHVRDPRLRVLDGWADRQFARVYRQGASRLCVSPGMSEAYAELYGVPGTVLYPGRPADVAQFAAPPVSKDGHSPALRVAFAGSVHATSLAGLLGLVSVLETLGGCLHIHSPLDPDSARRLGLDRTGVHLRPMMPASHLIGWLRDVADLLFVPMSFAERDRSNMERLFPSKLTDYTATGLPLLIWAPPYSSAARWARENPGVAEVVDREDPGALRAAIRRLATDPQHRYELGKRALETGRRQFSHAAIARQFYQALSSSPSGRST